MANQYGTLKRKMINLQSIVNRLENSLEKNDINKSLIKSEIRNLKAAIKEIEQLLSSD